ncbi:hypothetical protein ACFXKR_21470 [Streptomyces violascens]|uniref:hypothetical protein n=1 Tax=Streptomyces violascens TaxID=67381 RepID=UPI0036A5565C
MRRLADASVGGANVVTELLTQRFKCRNPGRWAVTWAYAEGARSGALQSVQVADAWHLSHNIGEAVEKTVASHHACVRTVFENAVPTASSTSDDIRLTPPQPVPAAGMLHVCDRERRLVTQTRERHTAVRQLLEGGSTLEHICRTPQLDRSALRRFARATSIGELLVKATNRSTILDEYKPYLHRRWNEGCHSTPELHQKIVPLGFAGSIQAVRKRILLTPWPDSVTRSATEPVHPYIAGHVHVYADNPELRLSR